MELFSNRGEIIDGSNIYIQLSLQKIQCLIIQDAVSDNINNVLVFKMIHDLASHVLTRFVLNQVQFLVARP